MALVFDLLYEQDWRCLYVKGTIPPEEFRAKAAQAVKDCVVAPMSVETCYARWCGIFDYDWFTNKKYYLGRYLAYPVKPGRGAFVITYSENFVCEDLDKEVE